MHRYSTRSKKRSRNLKKAQPIFSNVLQICQFIFYVAQFICRNVVLMFGRLQNRYSCCVSMNSLSFCYNPVFVLRYPLSYTYTYTYTCTYKYAYGAQMTSLHWFHIGCESDLGFYFNVNDSIEMCFWQKFMLWTAVKLSTCGVGCTKIRLLDAFSVRKRVYYEWNMSNNGPSASATTEILDT